MTYNRRFILLFLFSLLFTAPLKAQTNDFLTANTLIEAQRYEEALPILQELYSQSPDAGIFFDRLIDCLIYLKEFDQAIEIAQNQFYRNGTGFHILVRIAELHHLKGDTDRAHEVWDQAIAGSGYSLQIIYNVGNSMINRREFESAVELYSMARDRFVDSTLFINELANVHLQAGDYARAMEEYIRLVHDNPEQISFVQQRLLQMQDENLYQIAALQLEDHLFELDVNHASYSSLHQLLGWLLIETDEYRRALIAARQYESNTSVMNYSLYSIGSQLLSNNEFELAAEAYSYYAQQNSPSVKYPAMEQQAAVYYRWADFLSDYSLESYERRQELFQMAYELNERLLQEAPDYDYRLRVLIRQSEIALDTFYNRDEALTWIEILESEITEGSPEQAKANYLHGRIHLFDQSYVNARHLLTLANRNSNDSDLSEITRYYLSLTDFFSGDFEYAQLQLRTLERTNASYYANNALKLRVWIQDGIRSDSTGGVLNSYSRMLEELYHGNLDEAFRLLQPILDDPGHPLKDNALVEFTSRIDGSYIPLLYSLIDRYKSEERNSPLRERLLWEEAKMAHLIVESGITRDYNSEDLFSPETEQVSENEPMTWPSSHADVEQLYEQIIFEFPSGFYAPHAREELQKITELNS